MRKVPFIMFGLITISVMLVALKVLAVFYESMPKIEHNLYRNRDLSKLIDELMFEDNKNAIRIYWTDSMEKLAESGRLAVPDLIAAIETAHEKAASVKYGGNIQPEELINHDTQILQIRAAMVPGRIGDDRAIPVLTSLNCTDNRLKPYIDQAIKSIQEESKAYEVDNTEPPG
jgi:hypothetical protein